VAAKTRDSATDKRFDRTPLGTAGFVTELERRLGRPIARSAPGRKAVAIPVGEQLNLLQ
jgi:hypothetical protein